LIVHLNLLVLTLGLIEKVKSSGYKQMCGIVDVSCFVKMISTKACGCLDYSQILLKNMITTFLVLVSLLLLKRKLQILRPVITVLMCINIQNHAYNNSFT